MQIIQPGALDPNIIKIHQIGRVDSFSKRVQATTDRIKFAFCRSLDRGIMRTTTRKQLCSTVNWSTLSSSLTDLETKSKRFNTKTVTNVNGFTHHVHIYGAHCDLETILPIFELCAGQPQAFSLKAEASLLQGRLSSCDVGHIQPVNNLQNSSHSAREFLLYIFSTTRLNAIPCIATRCLPMGKYTINSLHSPIHRTLINRTMCSIQIEISPSLQKAPQNPTMQGELQSCRTFNSLIIWLRIDGLISK